MGGTEGAAKSSSYSILSLVPPTSMLSIFSTQEFLSWLSGNETD